MGAPHAECTAQKSRADQSGDFFDTSSAQPRSSRSILCRDALYWYIMSPWVPGPIFHPEKIADLWILSCKWIFPFIFPRSQTCGTHSLGPAGNMRFLGIHIWNSNDECRKSESKFSGFCWKVRHQFFWWNGHPREFLRIIYWSPWGRVRYSNLQTGVGLPTKVRVNSLDSDSPLKAAFNNW